MKILLLGHGSIGQRHKRNLMTLRPDAKIVIADPVILPDEESITNFSSWTDSLAAHSDADGAIIASPTEAHIEHMHALSDANIPFFVEKPIGKIGQTFDAAWPFRSAVGFCYRFHPNMSAIRKLAEKGSINFVARDDLVGRYGRNVAEIMASHALDLACYLLGQVSAVDLKTDGVEFTGGLTHERGISTFDIRMDMGPRVSVIYNGDNDNEYVPLSPSSRMYLDELRAWLNFVEMGKIDDCLATVPDGIRTQELLNQCRPF